MPNSETNPTKYDHTMTICPFARHAGRKQTGKECSGQAQGPDVMLRYCCKPSCYNPMDPQCPGRLNQPNFPQKKNNKIGKNIPQSDFVE
jgi:hypothetical protein